MLIISKFKDYYDQSAAFGVDKKIVFNRKDKELEYKIPSPFKVKELMSKRYHNLGYWFNHVKYGFVYLAGDIYPFVEINFNDINADCKKNNYEYIYDPKDFDRPDFKERFKKLQDGISFDFDGSSKVKNIKKSLSIMRDDLNKYYKEFLESVLIKNEAAYFKGYMKNLRSEVKVKAYIHPNLKNIGFGKILSAPELFTKIEQYVSSFNNRDDLMVEISDKDKAVARGHDGKYSFKTPPTKKES